MLEVLAFQYTQLPEPGTFVIGFLAIVIGAVLAASLMAPPEGLLSRSYYFQRIGIASLALVAVQATWLWYPTALAYGVSWLMLASDLLSALAYGAYMIRIAQADLPAAEPLLKKLSVESADNKSGSALRTQVWDDALLSEVCSTLPEFRELARIFSKRASAGALELKDAMLLEWLKRQAD